MAYKERFSQSDEPMEQREPSNLLEWPSRDRGRRSQYRRDELIRVIERSVEQLTLQELEALYYDMSTKNYINEQ